MKGNRTFNVILLVVTIFITNVSSLFAQTSEFTPQDTLRGSITKEREWWDLTFYHLDVKVDLADSTISGVNTIQYKVLESNKIMQIDLQPPMQMKKVVQNGKKLSFNRNGNVWFIKLKEHQEPDAVKSLEVYYGGKPKVSEMPPWKGGIVWEKDSNGMPFIANANQGDGASLWWPCKDHMYDEPDSMLISVNVPENLMDVSNGQLKRVEKLNDGTHTFHWFVANPINNYGVNISIADYAHFSETYIGEKGALKCDYFVLKENLEVARKQFKDVPRMLRAFEYWFGPYPFYEDGYKLIEVPYTGMEHQSAVTYGNGYKNGYRGKDQSETGWGFEFDFIIIHESGHEWFANNITYQDMADMWIHEGFTNYSESLFLDYHYGVAAGNAYVIGTRSGIKNDKPIIGPYNVNKSGSGDMYPKGGNMLHTIRQILNDDQQWRSILRGLNKDFYHQTVTTQQIEDYIDTRIDADLSTVFDQYLRDIRIPVLQYQIAGKTLKYRWNNCLESFNMPVKVYLDEEELVLNPTVKWNTCELDTKAGKLVVDPNFYVTSSQMTPD